MSSDTKKLKYRPEDINSALDDYKRQQDEETAWNQQPIVDVPKGRSTNQPSISPLAQAIGRKMKKIK